MKTAVIEKDAIGGRCLNVACIPAKAVLRVADILSEIRDADEFGIKVGAPEVDYSGVSDRRQKVISTLTGGVSGLFKKNKIDVIEGHGALAGDGRVTVGDQTITAKTIILATGSVARPIPGAQFGGRGDRHRGGVGAGCAAHVAGGRRRGRVGLGDRVRLCAARQRGDAAGGRWTACSRPRTPTSPSSPSAVSSGRG